MNWIEREIAAWQSIIDSLLSRGGYCPRYLERAYRTRDGYVRLLQQR